MIETTAQPTDAERRAAWNAASVRPLWEDARAHGGAPPPPRPQLWAWSAMKPLIDDAAGMNSTEVVERRVLSLMHEDPKTLGYPFTITNLNCGYQILLPGEQARPHRHSMNALRFVIDGHGANTVVDGKACPMHENDLILTPGWTWHEHVHPGDGPIVWLDVLDASLHRYLGTDAFEPGPVHDIPAQAPDAAYAFANLLPDAPAPGPYSPVFCYPWATAKEALAVAPRSRDGARRVRYVNPTTGGSTMTLLDSSLIEIDAGLETAPFRTSAHTVVAVIEGHGRTQSGDNSVSWGPKDIFTLPSGQWMTHRAGERARLFLTSDREILQRLGLLEETYRS
jgi:gentisate 1,2-dioxygenase